MMGLAAALIGVFVPGMYEAVAPQAMMPGILAQDYGSVVAALFLFAFALGASPRRPRLQIAAIGLLGYFFYAYGIYSIEQLYTPLYPLYMALFGFSFYGIVYGVASIRSNALDLVRVPRRVRLVSVVFLLLNPLVFYPLWIAMLVPLLQTGDRIEWTFSIFVLDLCFIMPAFVIAAYFTAKERGLGLIATPALFVLGVMLLGPLALGEFLKPGYGLEVDSFGLGLFGALSLMFLGLAILFLTKLDLGGPPPKGG